MKTRIAPIIITTAAYLVLATTVPAPPICSSVVTSTADDGSPGTLRAALACVPPGATITFALTTPATIILTSGELPVTKNVTILGPGADLLAVNGGGPT